MESCFFLLWGGEVFSWRGVGFLGLERFLEGRS